MERRPRSTTDTRWRSRDRDRDREESWSAAADRMADTTGPDEQGGLLPHHPEAERAVLGALLSEPEALLSVCEVLAADDFADPRHRLIYAALLALGEGRLPGDVLLVCDHLTGREELGDAGGASYVSELATGVPWVVNVLAYAQIVRREAVRRHAIVQGSRMVSALYQTPDVDAALAVVRAGWAEVEAHAEGGRAAGSGDGQPAGVGLDELLADLLARMRGERHGVTTGYPDLDRHLVSLEPTELVYVCARPAAGKSAFVQGILRHMAEVCEAEGAGTVEWVTLEMSRLEVLNRLVCSYAGVNTQLYRAGFRRPDGTGLAEQAYRTWREAYDEFYPMLNRRLYTQDTSCTMPQLRSRLLRAVDQRGCRLAVVDYAGLVRREDRRQGRYEHMTEVSIDLKLLAKDAGIPIIAVLQMNRGSETRENKRPGLADLRDSGQLEQDGNFVLGLYRPAYYDPGRAQADDAFKRFTEVLVLKAREGVGDQTMIPLRAELEYARFTTWPTNLPWPEDGSRHAAEPAMTAMCRSGAMRQQSSDGAGFAPEEVD